VVIAWLVGAGCHSVEPVVRPPAEAPETPEPTTSDIPQDTAPPTVGPVDSAESPSETPSPEDCANGVDDDVDGRIDCDDPECDTVCDRDQDGHLGPEFGGDDCDDDDASVHPGGLEVCDGGADNDCNGLADDDDPGVAEGSKIAWHIDSDADGWGRDGIKGFACAATGHQSPIGGDCADHDAAIHPGAVEVCDGFWDEDCDGLIDEADPDALLPRWWVDNDGDGWGGTNGWRDACLAPAGHVDNLDDCDDTDPAVGPSWESWFLDADGDGFGSGADVGTGCAPPVAGSVQDGTDCDDSDAGVFPGQTEVCDGRDQDCDGALDHEDDGAICEADPSAPEGELLCEVLSPWLPAHAAAGFGGSASVQGGTLAVGQVEPGRAGSVWTWTLAAGGWKQDRRWVGDDLADDGFGAAVAVDGDRLWVGAPGAGAVWSIHRDTLVASGTGPAEGRGGALSLAGASVWTTSDAALERWSESDGDWTLEHSIDFPGAHAVASNDAVVAATDGVTVAVWDADGAPVAAWAFDSATAVALDGGRLWAAAPGMLRGFVDVGGAWVEEAPPGGPTPLGSLTVLAFGGDVLWAGAADEPGIALAWVPGPAGFVEAFALLGPGPEDVPTDVGDAVALDNCLPFGAGGLYGPYAGFAWQGVPAFDARPGDTVAFDLHAANDVPIEAEIALAIAVDGTDEPAGPFTVVSSGVPADPDGNATQGDYELAWTMDVPWSFPGGGLIARVSPTGAFRSDDTCTGVLMGADADGLSAGVGRFWSDADGEWPWDASDSLRVASLRITLVGRAPAFGRAVGADGDIVVVGAPAPVLPVPEIGAATVCRPSGDPPAW
jgi:hypothetical protein